MTLPPLPTADIPRGCDYGESTYTADQMQAYAQAAVHEALKDFAGGVRVKIPTETMEQEIQSHVRRAVLAERAR